jgi:hypothetical protein
MRTLFMPSVGVATLGVNGDAPMLIASATDRFDIAWR